MPVVSGAKNSRLFSPEASLEFAGQRADELRKAFKNLRTQFKDQSLGVVTVSMGVASYPEHGFTGADLLRAADAALYLAKERGRDRVVVSTDFAESRAHVPATAPTKLNV